jgi:hypothetical protein
MLCIHQVDIEPVSSCSKVVSGLDGDGVLLEGDFSQYAGKNMPLTGRAPFATVLGYARSSPHLNSFTPTISPPASPLTNAPPPSIPFL